MSKELYKAFIDGLVERKDSMTSRWIKGDGFPRRMTTRRKTFFSRTDTGAERSAGGAASGRTYCRHP